MVRQWHQNLFIIPYLLHFSHSDFYLLPAKLIHQTTLFSCFSQKLSNYMFPFPGFQLKHYLWGECDRKKLIFSLLSMMHGYEKSFYVWRKVDLLYLSPHHMSPRCYKLIRGKHLSFTVNVLSNSVGVKSI